jgi:RNA polymerase sigma-70 factor (ECF subfamily)
MEDTAKFRVNITAEAASHSVDEIERVEPNDRQVVEHCQRGELRAYEILVNRYRDKVYGLAYSMLRNEQDAADVCQEAFVRAWQGIRRFKKNSSFFTWLYRITTNLCIDFVRKRDRRPTAPFEEAVDPDTDVDVQEPPSKSPSPTEEVQRSELRRRIDAALLELSPEHRAVIQLREYEGMEYAEIARAVGCSIGTVMSRLHYARKHLQRLLVKVI